MYYCNDILIFACRKLLWRCGGRAPSEILNGWRIISPKPRDVSGVIMKKIIFYWNLLRFYIEIHNRKGPETQCINLQIKIARHKIMWRHQAHIERLINNVRRRELKEVPYNNKGELTESSTNNKSFWRIK